MWNFKLTKRTYCFVLFRFIFMFGKLKINYQKKNKTNGVRNKTEEKNSFQSLTFYLSLLNIEWINWICQWFVVYLMFVCVHDIVNIIITRSENFVNGFGCSSLSLFLVLTFGRCVCNQQWINVCIHPRPTIE